MAEWAAQVAEWAAALVAVEDGTAIDMAKEDTAAAEDGAGAAADMAKEDTAIDIVEEGTAAEDGVGDDLIAGGVLGLALDLDSVLEDTLTITVVTAIGAHITKFTIDGIMNAPNIMTITTAIHGTNF